MFDMLIGMTLEDLGEYIEAQGWDQDWVMDQLYVSDRPDHWVGIDFAHGVVVGWEAV